jgi:UDP-N-acetylmuramyl pentapeptide synthase
LVGALSLAINFGLKIEEIKPLLKTLNPPQGSLEISQQDENILINDSYNANFDGVVNAIKLLYQIKQVKNNPQKPNLSVLFLDDILELGTKSTEIHIQLAKIINQNPPDITVLLGRNFSEIVQNELVKNGYDENQILNFKLLTATQIREIITKKASDKAKITLLEGFGSKKFV